MVPGPPLARHAPQQAAAVEAVSRVTLERHSAAGEVALVTHFGAELRHAWFIAVGQLETCGDRTRTP